MSRERISLAPTSVTQVSTSLSFKDHLEGWKVRWGIGRMNYRVNPGLYAVGNPTPESPVLVSANYKLSFDALRKELTGLNLWILVIDTHGVNVWCAAGKGTFGTKEIIKRIYQTRLHQVVTSRTLILPQLGAPGVAAHTITKTTRFKVIYGPVRASDLPAFIEAKNTATPEMRQVKFTLIDRLILTPIELVISFKYLAILFLFFAMMSLIQPEFNWNSSIRDTLTYFWPYLGAMFVGAFLVPVLLPWIPGRSFALKGWLLGILWASLASFAPTSSGTLDWALLLSQLFLLPAISSYLALNFTGSSTFTSLSGVQKEMKIALPLLACLAGFGIIFFIIHKVLQFV